jgi:hypothetical protein
MKYIWDLLVAFVIWLKFVAINAAIGIKNISVKVARGVGKPINFTLRAISGGWYAFWYFLWFLSMEKAAPYFWKGFNKHPRYTLCWLLIAPVAAALFMFFAAIHNHEVRRQAEREAERAERKAEVVEKVKATAKGLFEIKIGNK